jgi:hypothetical protein
VTEPQLPERELSRALSDLRDAVRRQAGPAPAAAILRRWAERRQRARRAASAVAAAAAVTAIVVGGVSVVRGDALPQPEPATHSPVAPTPSPGGATPSPVALPSAEPVRPDDPIVGVSWRTATITVPPHPGCPDGSVRLRQESDYVEEASGPTTFPRMTVDLTAVRYGDLTGDGLAEAILEATCLGDSEGSGDGEGQLLVVRRASGGRLTALGWVGPRGGLYSERWVAAGTLYVDVKPWHTDWGYSLGAVRAYRWQVAKGFAEVDTVREFPGLIPVTNRPGAPVDLTPVADRLACPTKLKPGESGLVLRLDGTGAAEAGGTQWSAVQPTAPDWLPHVIHIDGRPRLVVALYCDVADPAEGRLNLAVLERAGDGYRALDVVVPEDPARVLEWRYVDGRLTLMVGEGGTEVPYRWTGTRFAEVTGSDPYDVPHPAGT